MGRSLASARFQMASSEAILNPTPSAFFIAPSRRSFSNSSMCGRMTAASMIALAPSMSPGASAAALARSSSIAAIANWRAAVTLERYQWPLTGR